jgi:hypothetical protein
LNWNSTYCAQDEYMVGDNTDNNNNSDIENYNANDGDREESQ